MEEKDFIATKNYWFNTKPPLCPNEKEVEIYAQECKGSYPVCLFGLTRQLHHIADFMVDFNRIETDKRIIQCDWMLLEEKSKVIIGDGVINLLEFKLIDKALSLAEKFVTRIFTKKQEWMKYASFFPKDFPKASEVIPTQDGVVIAIYKRPK